MRRWVVALLLATGLVLVFAGVALANNGPHMGTFTGTTDACAGCHRVHRGQSSDLLKTSSEQALCDSCHGTGAPGANTDIANGLWVGTGGGGLRGGGFTQASMDTNVDGAIAAAAVTSKHNVGDTGLIIWGSGTGNVGAGATATAALQCSSCHNPHGVSGAGTYRILRPAIDWGGITTTASALTTITDQVGTKDYVVAYDPGNHYRLTSYLGAEISNWCSQCHTRYMSTSDATTGDAIFTYRHKTDNSDGDTDCLSCHVAHGTSASMAGEGGTTHSASVEWPGGTPAVAGANSRLLQVDNRGICVKCHVTP